MYSYLHFLKNGYNLTLEPHLTHYSKSMHTCFCHFWLKKHVKIQVENSEYKTYNSLLLFSTVNMVCQVVKQIYLVFLVYQTCQVQLELINISWCLSVIFSIVNIDLGRCMSPQVYFLYHARRTNIRKEILSNHFQIKLSPHREDSGPYSRRTGK